MVDEKHRDYRAWFRIKGLMPEVIDEDRGRTYQQKRDGIAYYAAKDLQKLGFNIDIPDEVEAAMNPPKPAAPTPEATVAAVRDNIGQVLYKGGAKIGDGIKGLFRKIVGENQEQSAEG